ncbi:MAG: TRAP transporter large permease [Aliihoeflea sp.]|uniref:TRAP transporter large permease n=1 Tax=Aliihoeflea sp. TaxID=2608088 RepID=UPI0040349A22
MGVWETSLIGFASLLGLMMAGMPLAFAMILVGAAGIVAVVGWTPALGMLGQVPVSDTMRYELSVVPMFVLMGMLVDRAGMSRDLYHACHGFLGHRRGGLAMATIVACAGFAAVSGSSLATAATMGRVSMPSMRRYGYSDELASGSIAAGGTLGILIPPSVILVLYGIMTGTDIGLLFIAGVLPGFVAVLFYIGTIIVVTRLKPEAGPRTERVAMRERFARLTSVGPILLLFVLIIGGIYLGVFTPTEAAGVGAFGAFLFCLWRRVLTPAIFLECVVATARMTAILFILLVGALLFSNFVNLAGLPSALQQLVAGYGLSPLGVIIFLMAIYIVLGCFLESLSMVLLTVPIFFPLVMSLGYDPIWFGIIVVMVTELSLITPPVGLNLFILKSTIGNISLGKIYRGIMPFVAADILRLALMIAFPAIILILPQLAR